MFGAAVVLAAGAALRGVVLRSSVGLQNSDEAQTGIQALELVRGYAWVFVPGTSYGGNAEAWLDAPFAWAFGASPFRTKVITSFVWLLAAIAIASASRSRGWRAALVAGATIWLPAAALMILSTQSYPGYATGLLATCVTIALAAAAVDGAAPTSTRAFGVGFTAAFAVWMHPLYVLVAGSFALSVALRNLRRWTSVLAPLGFGAAVAAALPILHNVRNGWPSLQQPIVPEVAYVDRVRAWFGDLFPRATGQKLLGPWVLGRASMAVAVVLGLGLVLACGIVLWRGRPAARLAAGVLVAAPFVLTVFRNTSYTLDGRYAVMVLPAAAFVVAEALFVAPGRALGGFRPVLLLGLWAGLATVLPLAVRLSDAGPVWATQPVSVLHGQSDVGALVQALRDRGVTTVRGDFWVAYRITYGFGEHVIASPIGYGNKFPRYEAIVRQGEAAGKAALVLFNEQVPAFDAGTIGAGTLARYRSFERMTVGSWTMFVPPRARA